MKVSTAFLETYFSGSSRNLHLFGSLSGSGYSTTEHPARKNEDV
jgi:hypothetical protein